MAYSAEDKMRIARDICEAVAARKTLTSALEAVKIPDKTFYNWCDENSEISELFKKAKSKAHELRTELLKEACWNQNERYILEGKKTVDKVWKPSDVIDENGVAKPKLVQMSERTEPCPPVILIFNMKNLHGWHDGKDNANGNANDGITIIHPDDPSYAS